MLGLCEDASTALRFAKLLNAFALGDYFLLAFQVIPPFTPYHPLLQGNFVRLLNEVALVELFPISL